MTIINLISLCYSDLYYHIWCHNFSQIDWKKRKGKFVNEASELLSNIQRRRKTKKKKIVYLCDFSSFLNFCGVEASFYQQNFFGAEEPSLLEKFLIFYSACFRLCSFVERQINIFITVFSGSFFYVSLFFSLVAASLCCKFLLRIPLLIYFVLNAASSLLGPHSCSFCCISRRHISFCRIK